MERWEKPSEWVVLSPMESTTVCDLITQKLGLHFLPTVSSYTAETGRLNYISQNPLQLSDLGAVNQRKLSETWEAKFWKAKIWKVGAMPLLFLPASIILGTG